jgi:7-cyano-7-deazaguanine synthase
MPKKAVVLLSGGLDSATAMAIAKADGFDVYALTVAYGQRHATEINASRAIASSLQAKKHVELEIDLRIFGGSALTDDIAVPKDRSHSEIEDGIPVTYVPARNTIFLSLALGWAETLGAFDIFAGVNAVDYSGYPDCRPEFIAAFQKLADLATKVGTEKTGRFQIHTPLIDLTKAAIIQKGNSLGLDYSLTSSCYDPNPKTHKACGRCDSCQIRAAGFADAGIADPTRYHNE